MRTLTMASRRRHTLARWWRVIIEGWDDWLATAIALNGTQPDTTPPTERCPTTPGPAGPAPGSAPTAPTSRHRFTDITVDGPSRYPLTAAHPGSARTNPS